MEAGVIAGLIPVRVNLDARVRDAVVVVIGVDHVEDAIVVIVGVGRIGCPVVVVVGVEEVWSTVAVKIAVDDLSERRCSLNGADGLVEAAKESRGRCSGSVDAVSLPVNVVNTARKRTVLVEGPGSSSVIERGGGGHLRENGSVIGMSVLFVGNAVAVIVGVKVVRGAISVEVARPRELVNSTVVVVVFVVSAGAGTVAVLVGHAIVVVVHGVLVSEVEVANRTTRPGVNGGGVEVAVGRNVSWIKALRFEGIVINGALENAVVVIVPVVHVQNTVVVVVVRVGAVTAVEALEQVVNAVVVVVKVVKVVDTIVVVVASPGLFEEGRIRGNRRFEHREVNDHTG